MQKIPASSILCAREADGESITMMEKGVLASYNSIFFFYLDDDVSEIHLPRQGCRTIRRHFGQNEQA